MDQTAAEQALMRHSGIVEPVEDGFLAMFRPYTGLDEARFIDLMTALQVVAPKLTGQPAIGTDLVNALWTIFTYTQQWVLHPEGMLRRNHLITERDLERVHLWMSLFSWAVTNLLQGVEPDEAFRSFREAFPAQTS